MAVSLNRFVFTQTYTMLPGTLTAGSWGSESSSNETLFGQTWLEGTAIMLDSGTPSALYTALNGAGVILACMQSQDDVGHAALAN